MEKTPLTENSPTALTPKAVEQYLIEKGMASIVDSFALSTILGTISQRMVRNFTNSGRLKSLSSAPPYIYNRADIVDFLLSNPRYIAQQRICWELTEDAIKLIRTMLQMQWRTLLRYADEEDILADAQLALLKTAKTPCALSTVVNRIFGKLYRRYTKRITTVPLQEGRYHE